MMIMSVWEGEWWLGSLSTTYISVPSSSSSYLSSAGRIWCTPSARGLRFYLSSVLFQWRIFSPIPLLSIPKLSKRFVSMFLNPFYREVIHPNCQTRAFLSYGPFGFCKALHSSQRAHEGVDCQGNSIPICKTHRPAVPQCGALGIFALCAPVHWKYQQ